MGFVTGFFSGFALTTSALYITIQVHRSNRLNQQYAIREQTKALNWLASPRGAYDRRLLPADESEVPLKDEAERLRPRMQDQLKHKWNEEVKILARKAYDCRWEDVRDTAVEGWRGAKRLVKRE
ncbi:hypothetical protein BJX99DRAFT_47118 [Aspergillus californicus]